MATFGIELNIKATSDLLLYTSGLSVPEIKLAINRSINYASKMAKVRMKRMVVEEYNIKMRDITDSDIIRIPSKQTTLTGLVYGSSMPESLGHFNPVQYKDNFGSNHRGGGGGGHTKIGKRGKGYTSTKRDRNTSKSGVYLSIVKGKLENIPSAWLYFSGSTPIVMARGSYKKSAGKRGKSSGFEFGKPRMPIQKLWTKSIYWGVMHPKTVAKWEPPTEEDYFREAIRQISVIISMRP